MGAKEGALAAAGTAGIIGGGVGAYYLSGGNHESGPIQLSDVKFGSLSCDANIFQNIEPLFAEHTQQEGETETVNYPDKKGAKDLCWIFDITEHKNKIGTKMVLIAPEDNDNTKGTIIYSELVKPKEGINKPSIVSRVLKIDKGGDEWKIKSGLELTFNVELDIKDKDLLILFGGSEDSASISGRIAYRWNPSSGEDTHLYKVQFKSDRTKKSPPLLGQNIDVKNGNITLKRVYDSSLGNSSWKKVILNTKLKDDFKPIDWTNKQGSWEKVHLS